MLRELIARWEARKRAALDDCGRCRWARDESGRAEYAGTADAIERCISELKAELEKPVTPETLAIIKETAKATSDALWNAPIDNSWLASVDGGHDFNDSGSCNRCGQRTVDAPRKCSTNAE